MHGLSNKVLVVEDEADIRDIIEYLLLEEGLIVTSTGRAGGFEEKVEEEHPDLIILDIRLPDGNGIDLCKLVKLNPLTCDIPVILMSAHAHSYEVQMASCANDFIPKPFDINRFVQKVQEQLIPR